MARERVRVLCLPSSARIAGAGTFLAAAVLLLAGCGQAADDVSRDETPNGTSGARAGPVAGTSVCTVYKRGSGLAVRVEGVDAEAVCLEISREWSNAYAFWSLQGDAGLPRSPTCSVAGDGMGLTVLEQSEGLSFEDGTGLCGSLVEAGFTELPLIVD